MRNLRVLSPTCNHMTHRAKAAFPEKGHVIYECLYICIYIYIYIYIYIDIDI